MQAKCNFVWPSNGKVCGGEVVPCVNFPRPEESGLMAWHRLYGTTDYNRAKENPDKAICLNCGTLHELQLDLAFQDLAEQKKHILIKEDS